jgi:F420-0:Gamma-glutamyl ligase
MNVETIKTHFITGSDKIEDVVLRYALPRAQRGDIIVLCEKIVSIMQNRVVRKKDVRLGFSARFLSKFAKKTPAGFSVGNPYKMQVAINLAGVLRIWLASVFGGIGKLIGLPGAFYVLAGHNISRIDGFYGEAFKTYNEIGILACKDGNEVCNDLKNKFNFSFAIADANDLGQNIVGFSPDLKKKRKIILSALKNNPAGQSSQQTPIIIIKNV